ncbi:MAG: hypothetical protein CVU46_09765 [Chloroflexi bacterium HGW-Chloroflexi-8]|nr:MAG: hypothetical protein CVU46_09765 [Chloroflexi bacterium HGW-Chloroflexi-8]
MKGKKLLKYWVPLSPIHPFALLFSFISGLSCISWLIFFSVEFVLQMKEEIIIKMLGYTFANSSFCPSLFIYFGSFVCFVVNLFSCRIFVTNEGGKIIKILGYTFTNSSYCPAHFIHFGFFVCFVVNLFSCRIRITDEG